MTEQTKLEVEVETCRHLEIDVEREDNVYIKLGDINKRKITVDSLLNIEPSEATCDITKKLCVLYNYSTHGLANYINFLNMERCPAFELTSTRYAIEGEKGECDFCVKKIKRVQK